MRERRRSDRYSSGLNGKGTLLAIFIVIVIGAVGGMASNDETEEVKEPKQEAKAEDKKETVNQRMSEKKIKTTVKVKSPSDVSNLNEIQQAVNTGEDDLRDAIDSTNQFVDDLVTKQEALRKSKNFAIQDFQKTITDDVVEKLDNQISLLNDVAQTAHSMATGVFLNNEKNISVEGTENLDFVKLEQLADNFNSMAFSLETYGMARSFESWEEASAYLPSRREESLLAIPLNEAIIHSSSVIDEPIIAEPVTEERNLDGESVASTEQTDAERYPEAITSVFKISEAMNAIYVTADELQQRFTPYEKEDGFGQFEYISVDDLDDLYKFDATVANEITVSIHFEAPDYTTDGFTQAMDSHL
ncbi:hypothetical protein [Exiguobacterium artemiae]|uniref:hypothetical protein n=1 Tax=Exiguobacterium artemiae TaxID=340145 RepID=UPI0029643008|nr:hypothetical protein [Exiguobacterium sibiricum]MDW2887111.1 hypothetical protein [Exiguobacterium sibiricum]